MVFHYFISLFTAHIHYSIEYTTQHAHAEYLPVEPTEREPRRGPGVLSASVF